MKRISIILLIVLPWTATLNVLPQAGIDGGTFRNLGQEINSEGDEYLPVVYNDTLYFRRSSPDRGQNILMTGIKGFNCRNELMSFDLIQTQSFNNSIVDPDRTIKSNLSSPSFANYSDTIQLWAPSREIEELSSEGDDFHPAFSVTGDTLVFASTRPDPDGQSDLYVTVRRPNGSWSRPRRLPRGINSSENEISPYIAPDGTLYYASKGFTEGRATIAVSGKARSRNSNLFFRESALNYDIIKAELGNNFWTDPVKLPYPINTEWDDLGPTVYNGKIFLASNRPDSYDWGRSYGGFDIYGWCDDNCCDTSCAPIAIMGKVGGSAFELAPYAVVEIVKLPEEQTVRTVVLENQKEYYVEVPHHDEYAVRTYHNCLTETTKYKEERFEHLCNTCCLDTFLIETNLEGGCPDCDNTNTIAGAAFCDGSDFICGSYVILFDGNGMEMALAEIDSNGNYVFENVAKKEDYTIRLFSDCIADSIEYMERMISDLEYSPTGDGKNFRADFDLPGYCCEHCPNLFIRGRTLCGDAHSFDYSRIMAFDDYGNQVGETLTNRFGEFNLPVEEQCPTDSLRIRLITDCVIAGYVEQKIPFECPFDTLNILNLDFDYPRNCCVSCETLLVEGRVKGKGVGIGTGDVKFYRNFVYSEPDLIFEIPVNADGSFFAELPYWPEYTVKFSADCLEDTLSQILSADYPCEKGKSQYLFAEFDITGSPCSEDVCTDIIHNLSTKSFNIFVENSVSLATSSRLSRLGEDDTVIRGGDEMASLRDQMNAVNRGRSPKLGERVDKAVEEMADIVVEAVKELAECPDCNFYEVTVTGYNDYRSDLPAGARYSGREISNGGILLLPYSVISKGMEYNDILIGELRAYNLIVEIQRRLLENGQYLDYADKISWKAVGVPEVRQTDNTAELRIKCTSSPKKLKKLKMTNEQSSSSFRKGLPKYYGSQGVFEGMPVATMIDRTEIGGKDEFAVQILFDFDTAELKPSAFRIIDEVVDELKSRPDLELEIRGYTDNIGTPEYNLSLSRQRAKKVYDEIIKRGNIDSNRLRYTGLRDQNPTASNDTPRGRAKNRRTVFKVLNK